MYDPQNEFEMHPADAYIHRRNAYAHHRSMMRHILILWSVLYTLIALFTAFYVFAMTWRWAGPGMFLLTLLLAGGLAYAGYIGWHAWKMHGEMQLANMTPKEHLNYYQPEWKRVTILPPAVWASRHAQPVRYARAEYQGNVNSVLLSQAAYDDEMQDYEDAREFWEITHIGPEPL